MIRLSWLRKIISSKKIIIFLSMFSSFAVLGNFTNASMTIRNYGVYGYNPYNQSVNVNITTRGALLSESLGYTKKLFSLKAGDNDTSIFFRTNGGVPYYYGSSHGCSRFSCSYGENQGKLTKYYVCSELLGNESSPSNCQEHSITDSTPALFGRFFSTITTSDYFGFDSVFYNPYDIAGSCKNDYICFSNSSVGSSLCFYAGVDLRYCSNHNGMSLTGSYNLARDVDWLNISDSILTLPPNTDGYVPGGSYDISVSTGNQVPLTGNLVYSDKTCTYGQILNYLKNAGYNKYLCYGGLDNFDYFDSSLSYSPIPGTGKTLGQILTNASSTWDSPLEWYNFWNGLYQEKNKYISMWESYPAVYRTWFDLYYQYGGSSLIFETVNEYCNMLSLVSDYNQIYNGTYFKNTCQNYIIPNNNNGGGGLDNDDDVVAVDLSWVVGGDDSGGSGDSIETYNLESGRTFISNITNSLRENFRLPNKSDYGFGYLPDYIIRALLGLIFFRFLSH